MSLSLFHRPERRAIDPTGSGFSNWDSIAMTGVVPPHGYDYMNRAGVEVTPKTVLGIGVVQRCLEVIQNAMFVMGPPRAHRRAFDKDGFPYPQWIPEKDPQYPSVLSQPWGTTRFADNAPVAYNIGAGRTFASLGLFGSAWWLCTSRSTYGKMAALEVLHPSFIDFGPPGKPVDSIWYGIGNQRVELDPADMVPLYRLILPGDRAALSPVKSQASIFAIAIAAVQYSQMWFSQGGQPGYVLTTDNKLNPDDIDRIFEHILLEHSGLNKAYNPLILDSGVKPSITQMDPEKSQMNETLGYVRQEIAGYFGLPLHLVGAAGDSGNVWGKGIQEINYSMNDFTLSGYRIPFEEAFSSIIPRGQYAKVNERAILRANSLDNSHASLANRQGAVTTPNEERRLLGLPPLSEPSADSITTPLNSNIPPPPDNSGSDSGAEGEAA